MKTKSIITHLSYSTATELSKQTMEFPYNVEIKIPFPSIRYAEIAYNVLRIDAEPRRSLVTKEIQLNENNLLVQFSATQPKHLRVGVSSFFEALILCTETMNDFGPPTDQYDYE